MLEDLNLTPLFADRPHGFLLLGTFQLDHPLVQFTLSDFGDGTVQQILKLPPEKSEKTTFKEKTASFHCSHLEIQHRIDKKRPDTILLDDYICVCFSLIFVTAEFSAETFLPTGIENHNHGHEFIFLILLQIRLWKSRSAQVEVGRLACLSYDKNIYVWDFIRWFSMDFFHGQLTKSPKASTSKHAKKVGTLCDSFLAPHLGVSFCNLPTKRTPNQKHDIG